MRKIDEYQESYNLFKNNSEIFFELTSILGEYNHSEISNTSVKNIKKIQNKNIN